MEKKAVVKNYIFLGIMLGAMIIGALVGWLAPSVAPVVKPLGTVFINMMFLRGGSPGVRVHRGLHCQHEEHEACR